MPAATRLLDQGSRLAARHAHDVGDEFRERRLSLGTTQADIAAVCRMSRARYGKIESGHFTNITLLELDRIAAVLGLAPSIRLYPAVVALRDAGQLIRLRRFLEHAKQPLTSRLEVALPPRDDRIDLRAWDAVLFGHGAPNGDRTRDATA
jgi:transcriptional regulator with XRE-family HTH domain